MGIRHRIKWLYGTYFDWSLIRGLGNSRLIGSSIIWLFFVPIAAKLLYPFAGDHKVFLPGFDEGSGRVFDVSITLPFSWIRFYFMAWAFSIGLVIYWFQCPEFVRRFRGYGEFRANFAGATKLAYYAQASFVYHSDSSERDRLVRRIFNGTRSLKDLQDKCSDLAHVWHAVADELQEKDSGLLSDVFDFAHYHERHIRKGWFRASAAAFGLGCLAFVSTVLEGLISVIRCM